MIIGDIFVLFIIYQYVKLSYLNLFLKEWNEKAAEAKKDYEKAMKEYQAKRAEASDEEGEEESAK